MPHSHTRILTATAAALCTALGLGACSLGPVDFDDFLMSTSVAEARAERVAELEQVVDDSLLKKAGTLTVGIPAVESVPLAVAMSDGSRAGMDVDTAHALADALGLASVSFVSVSEIPSALEESCDVVMGVAADGSSSVTPTGDYAQSATGLFTTQDVTAPIDASALSGASVGVQEGSISQKTMANLETGATETTFANLNEAFEALQSGSVAYVACDAYAGAYLQGVYEGISFAGTVDDPIATGIAASSDELASAIQTALETIQSNGVNDIIRSRWLCSLPMLTESTKVSGIVVREPEPVEEEEPAEGEQGSEDDAASEDGATSEGESGDQGAAPEQDAGTGDYSGDAYAEDYSGGEDSYAEDYSGDYYSEDYTGYDYSEDYSDYGYTDDGYYEEDYSYDSY